MGLKSRNSTLECYPSMPRPFYPSAHVRAFSASKHTQTHKPRSQAGRDARAPAHRPCGPPKVSLTNKLDGHEEHIHARMYVYPNGNGRPLALQIKVSHARVISDSVTTMTSYEIPERLHLQLRVRRRLLRLLRANLGRLSCHTSRAQLLPELPHLLHTRCTVVAGATHVPVPTCVVG